MGFIRKVYGILSVQLLVTFGMVAVFTFSDPVKKAVQSSPAALWAAIILSFGFLIALSCCPKVAQTYPTNYLCLAGFTLTEGYLVGVISSTYDSGAVMKAVGVTVFVTVALTIFAWQTKIDFTGMGSALFVILIVFTLFGFLCAIFRSSVLDNVYASIGALIFSAYIVYDTQLILGGNHQHKFSIDQYVFAALSLYLDIVNLFLYLLRLFGTNRT
jgi:protein lifeguard